MREIKKNSEAEKLAVLYLDLQSIANYSSFLALRQEKIR